MRDEEFSDAANALRSPANQLLAPDLVFIELANVLRTWARSGVLPEDTATLLVESLGALGLSAAPSDILLPAAFRTAVRFQRSVYDALYLALAEREGCPFITADLRLYNALFSHFPDSIQWIGDMAPPDPAE